MWQTAAWVATPECFREGLTVHWGMFVGILPSVAVTLMSGDMETMLLGRPNLVATALMIRNCVITLQPALDESIRIADPSHSFPLPERVDTASPLGGVTGMSGTVSVFSFS